jgi:hypothetical protein
MIGAQEQQQQQQQAQNEQTQVTANADGQIHPVNAAEAQAPNAVHQHHQTNEISLGQSSNGLLAPPAPQSVEMQTAEPLPPSGEREITVEEYRKQYEELNKYVDEIFKDLESNYKNAFDAIEKQFNQIFDKISQFEESLKDVLNTPQTAGTNA